jgi:hypothetical protein
VTRSARAGALALLGALALAADACGYAFGSGLHEHDIRTVHVRAVANDTYRQRLEAELGAAVARELAVSSDLLPGDAATADAVLEIRIESERERTLVTGDRTAPVTEGAQEATVRVVLTARRTGERLVDHVVADRAEFRDPIGEDLTSARREMVADLARKIVLALETRF